MYDWLVFVVINKTIILQPMQMASGRRITSYFRVCGIIVVWGRNFVMHAKWKLHLSIFSRVSFFSNNIARVTCQITQTNAAFKNYMYIFDISIIFLHCRIFLSKVGKLHRKKWMRIVGPCCYFSCSYSRTSKRRIDKNVLYTATQLSVNRWLKWSIQQLDRLSTMWDPSVSGSFWLNLGWCDKCTYTCMRIRRCRQNEYLPHVVCSNACVAWTCERVH